MQAPPQPTAQRQFTMIFYVITEDLDDIDQPNAYGVHKAMEDIRQSDIAESFPIKGNFIFRFRYKFQNQIVWMDITNSQKIPLFNGKIFVKATRVSSAQSALNKLPQQLASPVSSVQVNKLDEVSIVKKDPVAPEVERAPKPLPIATREQNVKTASGGTTNLLDDFDDVQPNKTQLYQQQKPPQSSKPVSLFEDDLLDMNDLEDEGKKKSKSAYDASNDLLDF